MRSRWDDVFKDDVWEYPPKARRVRLWEEIFTVPMHYVLFPSKDDGKITGFYDLCLNWDYDKEEPQPDGGCEACRLQYRASRYGYGYLIDRRDQNKSGDTVVRPVRLAPKLIGDIVAISQQAYPEDDSGKRSSLPKGWEEDEPPDATHPQYGFDISLNVDTGSNKKATEYKVFATPDGVKPLTKEEIAAFKAYAKRVPYQALVKAALISPEEQKRKYIEQGIMPAEKKKDDKPSRTKRDDSADYRKYDTVPSDDDGDRRTERRSAITEDRPSAKADTRRSALLDDEDEPRKPAALARPSSRPWDDEDEDEAPAAGRNYASASAREAPSDDDLD